MHAPMKNITVAVNEELFRHARICAAQRSTTVTELVRCFLLNLKMIPDNAPSLRFRSVHNGIAAGDSALMMYKSRASLGENEGVGEKMNTPHPSPQ